MQLLENIKRYALQHPERIAVNNPYFEDSTLTYEQLDRYSDVLAGYICEKVPDDKSPITVYGYRHPYTIAIFLACVKAGHPYCPVDPSDPEERLTAVMNKLASHIVMATEDCGLDYPVMSLDEIKAVCHNTDRICIEKSLIEAEDLFYIIFTSGSTGMPKGVEITADCLDNFLKWSETMVDGCQCDDFVFLNQSPLNFDLSVMDLYTSLYTGGTFRVIDKEIQKNFKKMMTEIKESGVVVWVSTPSLAEMCLMDKKFTQETNPEIKVFFFCGEALANNTAQQLLERFPGAKVLNTYGPTESTVAVTLQEISPEIAQRPEPLPVGKPKAGTVIEIWDENGNVLPQGEKGEIIIKGDTVAKGYFKLPEETERAFIYYEENGKHKRAYRTGDIGFIDENGVLRFAGRNDSQIQLHGYRVELGEIESKLMSLDFVSGAVVLPKVDKNDKVRSLTAFVTLEEDIKEKNDEQQIIRMIKEGLSEKVPQALVPKKIICLEQMPRNRNDKLDRKKLAEMV